MTPQISQRLATYGIDGIGRQPVDPGARGFDGFYFEFHEQQGEGYLAHLHDPLAAAVALDPALIRTRAATVGVELTGTLTRAMTIVGLERPLETPAECPGGRRGGPAVFFDRFIQRVGPFARRCAHS